MSTILEIFENTVSKYEDKKAIASDKDSYTFGQLYDRARREACILQTVLSGNDNPVAVFADKNIGTVRDFFGVLYSGNYYIPIDKALPEEKIKCIFQDAGIKTAVGKAEMSEEICKYMSDGYFIAEAGDKYHLYKISAGRTDKVQSININRIAGESLEGIKAENISDDNLMYMVYTSGSTGVPKGVIKNHRAMASFVKAYIKTFEIKADDILGNQTPFFFDASAKDIYIMSSAGATLEIMPEEYFILPYRLIEYMNEKKVSVISWVPSALCVVTKLNTFSAIKPEYLRKVFFVGEVFPIKELRKWKNELPEVNFVNLYGSSEIAGISCYYRVGDIPEDATAIPIGRPLENCEVFLEDGEVCVSGDSLALGYYNDREKTDKVFEKRDGRIVYHTGDIAYYDDDGNIVFSTRKDYQIKHMGRRIELGEIESIAQKTDEIAKCCCLYDSEKQKIVMFVETDNKELKPIDIKRVLKQVLTEYMVPAKVVILDKLPVNANGKTDRNILKQQL